MFDGVWFNFCKLVCCQHYLLRISNSCISNIFSERLDIGTEEYNHVVAWKSQDLCTLLLSCYLPSNTRCNVVISKCFTNSNSTFILMSILLTNILYEVKSPRKSKRWNAEIHFCETNITKDVMFDLLPAFDWFEWSSSLDTGKYYQKGFQNFHPCLEYAWNIIFFKYLPRYCW